MKKHGKNIYITYAQQEMIADFIGDTILGKNTDIGEVISEFDRLSKTDRTLFQKIMDTIKDWLDNVLKRYKNRNTYQDVKYITDRLSRLYDSRTKTATENGDGVKYALSDDFSAEFDKAIFGDDYYKNNAVVVGKIPSIYSKYGFDANKPMTITARHLKDITHPKQKDNNKYHGLTKDNVINAISQLENPALLIISPSNNDVLVAFTTETDSDGVPIAVYISKSGKAYINFVEESTNHILSIYGRDNTKNFIQSALNDDRIVDGNKIRATELQNILGLSLSLPDNILSIGSNNSISTSDTKSQEKFSDDSSEKRYSLPTDRERKLVMQFENGEISRETLIKELESNTEAVKKSVEYRSKQLSKRANEIKNMDKSQYDLAQRLRAENSSTADFKTLRKDIEDVYDFAKSQNQDWDAINKRVEKIAHNVADAF